MREIIEKTGTNRTTVQRMTAPLRKKIRQRRKAEAAKLLRKGLSKAEVARSVKLSPSRIWAMFPGKQEVHDYDTEVEGSMAGLREMMAHKGGS